MTLRAIAGQNPTLSVATDAALLSIDTGFLVPGDYIYSEQSGGYIYLPTSTAALSATVKATANSLGGTLPGRFIFNGFSPSGITNSIITVTGPAQLPTVNDSIFTSGELAWDQTLLTYWTLDKAATEAIDGIMVAATLSGTGRWMRMLSYNSLHWIQQSAWFVDPTAGSDLNSGLTSITALQTIKEWWRRTGGKYSGIPTLTCLADMSSGDGFWYPTFNVLQSALRAFVASGTPVVTRTVATLTSSGAAQNAATNTSPTFTDAAVVSWAADVGNFIYTTSGPTRAAIVLADLGGGVARVSQWFDPATLVSATAPTLVSYQVSRPSRINLGFNNTEPFGGSQITLKRFHPLNGIGAQAQSQTIFAECKITLGTSFGFVGRGTGGATFACTAFSGATFPIVGGGCTTALNFCGFTTTGLGVTASAVIMTGCVWHASSLTLGANQSGDEQQGSAVFASDNGFFSAGTAVALTKRSMAAVRATSSGTLYGSGNTTCVSLRGHSAFMVRSGYTPTITGTTEISWPNGASQIPPLVAGAVVPAAAACSTWATWAAAPFSKFCYNYGSAAGGDGSALITG